MPVVVPPKGTKGTLFPRFLVRLGSRFVPRMFRRGRMRTGGGIPTLMLETVGAKTGQPRQAILGFFEDGPSAWLVIASLAGASRHPAWLHNLAKQPDAMVEFFGGERVPVHAETLTGPDLDAAWRRMADEAPEYVKYLSKTDREIPKLRLRQRPA